MVTLPGLLRNLSGITDCGIVDCADLRASAAGATVGIDFSSLDVCPSTKVIVCENGNATSVGGVAVNSSITCKEACGGNCCVGGISGSTYFPACDGLTSSICMDGKTCNGGLACEEANVSWMQWGGLLSKYGE